MFASNNTTDNGDYYEDLYMPSFAENLIIGSLYLVFGLAFLITNIVCLVAMLKTDDLISRTSYKLMATISVLDCVQLVILGPIAGLLALGQYKHHTIEKVLGGVLYGAAECIYPLISCLTFDRFLALWFPHMEKQVFNNKKLLLWEAMCLCYGLIYFVSYTFIDGCDQLFDLRTLAWNSVEGTVPDSINYFEYTMDMAQNGVYYVWYALIAVKLVLLRKQTTQRRLSKKERVALLQGFVLSFNTTVAVAVWFAFPMITSDPWSITFCNWTWLYQSGATSFIYMICNGTLRESIRCLLHDAIECLSISVSPLFQKQNSVVPALNSCVKIIAVSPCHEETFE